MRAIDTPFAWREPGLAGAVKTWIARFRASVDGLSPERLALLLSVGLVLGLFPVAGCPTALCLLAALGLRLNFAALQLLNNVSTPLQLALLLPLARVGARFCGGSAYTGSSPAGELGVLALHAVAGWAGICIPLGALLYVVLVSVMRRGRSPWLDGLKSPA